MASELSVLFDLTHTGTQNAGTQWKPAAKDGKGELDAGEVAEIVFIEIFSPLDGSGNPEDLKKVYLVLDGKSYADYVMLSGRYDSLMTPPKNNVWNGRLVAFGRGIRSALQEPVPALANTTPKFRRDVTVVTEAGASAVTADYRIRIWGYRYSKDVLPRILPQPVMPGGISISDRERGRILSLARPTLPIDYDHWTQLPGGLDQAVPKVNPFWRFARNANATTPNTPYIFRFSTGQVAEEFEDLYFPYDQENEALLVHGLGIRAGANLKETWVELTGDPDHKEHPKNRVPTLQFNNPLHFGHGYPLFPQNLPVFFGIPAWQNKPLLIDDDKAYVAIQDNGAAVGADGVVVALNGVLIEKGAR